MMDLDQLQLLQYTVCYVCSACLIVLASFNLHYLYYRSEN